MKSNLRTQLNTALQDVDWHNEQQVLRMIRQQRTPVRHAKPSKALVFAMVLILALVTTAAALTLNFSTHFNAQLQSRQAVQNQYGLSDEMMDLFTYAPVKDEGNTVARFTMNLMHGDQLGEYTVMRLTDGSLGAAWSHDDADQALVASGSLASPAWGAKQLERILHLYREKTTKWQTVLNYDELTLAERAALDAPMLNAQETGALICIAPDASDLTVEAAESIAREAITEKYGVAEDALVSCKAKISFFLYGGTERREYRVDTNGYVVYVASPSGAVTHCSWNVSAQDRTLPEGDLSRYPIAAKEFITSGAFECLSAEEKAAVTQRYLDAGLDALLPRNDFVAPLSGETAEAEAQTTAEATLTKAYGLPMGWTNLFLNRASMVSHDGYREWIIEYIPHELDNWHWRDFDKLGIYTVILDAETGEVISHDWSFKDVQLAEYTESNFALAPAYSGAALPWVQALLADLQTILDKYPQDINLDEMALEDRGAYDARMRSAGYPASQYPNLIPTASDMPQDQAAALALDALNTMYGLNRLSLERGKPYQEGLYMAQTPDGSWIRVWAIAYVNNMDMYTVRVNTETGEIEGIWHDSPAFGNS